MGKSSGKDGRMGRGMLRISPGTFSIPFRINLGLIEFEANTERGASMLAQTLAMPGWINMASGALYGDLKVLIVKHPA